MKQANFNQEKESLSLIKSINLTAKRICTHIHPSFDNHQKINTLLHFHPKTVCANKIYLLSLQLSRYCCTFVYGALYHIY